MSEEGNSEHRNAYKNNLKNGQEMRRRRREVTVRLRKSRKEDQMCKQRNIEKEDPTPSASGSIDDQPEDRMMAKDIVEAMTSSDPDRQLIGTEYVWNHRLRGTLPFETMVELGIIPIYVGYLARSENFILKLEAALALADITSGTADQTRAVIEAGAIPYLVQLLYGTNLTLAEQAVLALGNIAIDGIVPRNEVLSHNAVEGLIELTTRDIPNSCLRNIVWAMSNLCRFQNSSSTLEKINILLPVLSQLLGCDDMGVVEDACWALSYVTANDENTNQLVIDTGAVPKLVCLLDKDECSIINPTLAVLGNILSGPETQKDSVIAAGALPRFSTLLQHSQQYIVKETVSAVSNIISGSQKHLQEILATDIFHHICNILEKGNYESQSEAAWVVTNITTFATPPQIDYLIKNFNIMKPYLNLLATTSSTTIKVVLKGLHKLYLLAKSLGDLQNFCLMIEGLGGLDKLEALQNHHNQEIYNLAYKMIVCCDAAADDSTLES